MTDLFDDPAAGWDLVRGYAPEACDALIDLRLRACGAVPAVLVELCRLRMATLLGSVVEQRARCPRARAAGLGEGRIEALPRWPSDPRFTPVERSCLALAEQLLLDVNGVDDTMVASLVDLLGAAQAFALVAALWTIDAVQRTWLILGIDSGVEVLELVPTDGR